MRLQTSIMQSSLPAGQNLNLKRSRLGLLLTLSWLASTSVVAAQPQATPATGPLRVHPTNPRYFTDESGKAIYLTGSHPWNNLQDVGDTDPPTVFDFDAYLDFLEQHGHNFIRLWRMELPEWKGLKSSSPPLRFSSLHPWKRSGPGNALDGRPKCRATTISPCQRQ